MVRHETLNIRENVTSDQILHYFETSSNNRKSLFTAAFAFCLMRVLDKIGPNRRRICATQFEKKYFLPVKHPNESESKINGGTGRKGTGTEMQGTAGRKGTEK